MGGPGWRRARRPLSTGGPQVSTIFQASSESSIGFPCLGGGPPRGGRARAGLPRGPRTGLGGRDQDPRRRGRARGGGQGMAGPGHRRRSSPARQGGVNVIAIAQARSSGTSRWPSSGQAEAARRVHAAFQLSKSARRLAGARAAPTCAPRFAAWAARSRTDPAPPRALTGAGGWAARRLRCVFPTPRPVAAAACGACRVQRTAARPASARGRRAGSHSRPRFIARPRRLAPIRQSTSPRGTGTSCASPWRRASTWCSANKKPLAGAWPLRGVALRGGPGLGRRIRHEATWAPASLIDTYRKWWRAATGCGGSRGA